MKKFLAPVLAFGFAAFLSGCGGEAESVTQAEPQSETTADTQSVSPSDVQTKGAIGMCAASLGFDFQLQMSNGIERAAKEFGYDYKVYDYNFDAENMVSGMETLVSSGVGAYYGLFTAPDSAISNMKENPDVGVLTQGEVVDGAQAGTMNDYIALAKNFIDALDYYVTENNIEKGDIAGLWLVSCESKDSDYYTAKEDMKKIILEYCESKGFNYASDYYPNDDEEASNITAQILNATPEVRFIFCFNNGFAISATNEISSAVMDAKDYFVFSSEGDDESFRLINDAASPYRGCAYMDIEESGYQVGLQLINWMENKEMENVIVEKSLVDSRNVAEYMK